MASASILNLTPICAGGDIPQHQDPRPEVAYNGPTMRWLIDNRKLAHQIIACHSLPPSSQILDVHELARLRLYVSDHSPAGVERLLSSGKMQAGSLVGHAVRVGGFDEESLKLLETWFDSGVLDAELEGVEV